MKLRTSIALNLVLLGFLAVLGTKHLNLVVNEHYYHEFTGIALASSAEQIREGHSDLVQKTLSEVKAPLTYADLGAIVRKLESFRERNSQGPTSR